MSIDEEFYNEPESTTFDHAAIDRTSLAAKVAGDLRNRCRHHSEWFSLLAKDANVCLIVAGFDCPQIARRAADR